jgi:hypothetical protein
LEYKDHVDLSKKLAEREEPELSSASLRPGWKTPYEMLKKQIRL